MIMNQQEKELLEVLKTKYNKKEATGYEVVIVLMAAVEEGRVRKSNFKHILKEILGSELEMLKALAIAKEYIDKSLIDEILGR
jgi:hypothetical protein